MDWAIIIAGAAAIVSVPNFLLRMGDSYPSHREHNDLKGRVKRLEDTIDTKLRPPVG